MANIKIIGSEPHVWDVFYNCWISVDLWNQENPDHQIKIDKDA